MDFDMRLNLGHSVDAYKWLSKYPECRKTRLLPWVSSFHKSRLSCRLAHDHVADEARGSYNWSSQVIFSNGESWMVRFPRGGKVSYPDEKVENEVAAMLLIQKHTDVPIPEVMAWGLSSDNALALGPFIMTRFVEGISLGSVLQDTSVDYRLMGDVHDVILERVLRQIIRIQLQLARLNFARIGCPSFNLDKEEEMSAFTATVNKRPFGWKTHEILHYGGVDVLCDPKTTFDTTTDYFRYLAEADMKQLIQQHNSVDDPEDAEEKYRYWKVMLELAPQMSLPQYEKGPFKLICDDFNPTNMLVNNTIDLEIVAVVDWEWSYAGPYQMFWSPPRWLIMRHPTGLSAYGDAFNKYKRVLEMYISILEEEEEVAATPDVAAKERPSTLIKQSLADGRAWYHQIMQAAFNGPFHVPFRELEKTLDGFEDMADNVELGETLDFVEMKKRHLQIYEIDRLCQEEAERSVADLLIH